MRLAPIDAAVQRLLDFSTSSDVPLLRPGTMMNAVGTDFDLTANVSNWGACEVMSVSSNGAAVIPPGQLVIIDKNFRISLTAASQANKGSPVYVTLTNFQIGSTTEQYGWVLRSGICPIAYSVAATVGNVYGGTAGKATPTAAAGVQILNAICLTAAIATFTKGGTTRNGSSLVKLGNLTGVYVGQAISGTGIPGASVVSAMNPDGTSLIIGSAVGTPVSATATGTNVMTFTNTGFGICQIDRPTFQSQIT